ncbi:hypothetical protein GGR52DRAFT_6159 [Hypoxylon sp. FL1284]|nr:hypothetical protein GGR52DRAFT_6159 [Hypoxylon sp. FL1284]
MIEESGDNFDISCVALFSEQKDAVLILILHGWPGGFLESLPIPKLLKGKYTPETLPYHVVVPSSPGYAYPSGELRRDYGRVDGRARLRRRRRENGRVRAAARDEARHDRAGASSRRSRSGTRDSRGSSRRSRARGPRRWAISSSPASTTAMATSPPWSGPTCCSGTWRTLSRRSGGLHDPLRSLLGRRLPRICLSTAKRSGPILEVRECFRNTSQGFTLGPVCTNL